MLSCEFHERESQVADRHVIFVFTTVSPRRAISMYIYFVYVRVADAQPDSDGQL